MKLLTEIQLQWAAEVKSNLNCMGIDMPIICSSTVILVLYALEILLLLKQVFTYRSKSIKNIHSSFSIILLSRPLGCGGLLSLVSLLKGLGSDPSGTMKGFQPHSTRVDLDYRGCVIR